MIIKKFSFLKLKIIPFIIITEAGGKNEEIIIVDLMIETENKIKNNHVG